MTKKCRAFWNKSKLRASDTSNLTRRWADYERVSFEEVHTRSKKFIDCLNTYCLDLLPRHHVITNFDAVTYLPCARTSVGSNRSECFLTSTKILAASLTTYKPMAPPMTRSG